jgi:hypothetical protein
MIIMEEIKTKTKKFNPKAKRVYKMMTKEDKLTLLRDYDLSGKVRETCQRYSITPRTFYQAKELYWGEYLEQKSAEGRLNQFSQITLRSNNIRAKVETETSNVLMKCLKIIDIRLDREMDRLNGNGSGEDKLRFDDITKFFAVAGPYILKTNEDEAARPKNIMEHHTFITNILNQQVKKLDGNNGNTNTGN